MYSDIESNEVIEIQNIKLSQIRGFKDLILWTKINIWLIIEFFSVFGICYFWNYLMHNPLCNGMFQCGCTIREGDHIKQNS